MLRFFPNDKKRRPFTGREIYAAGMEKAHPLSQVLNAAPGITLAGGAPIDSGLSLSLGNPLSVVVSTHLIAPPAPTTKVIPVLTGADSRLTTSIPMIDSGTYPWWGFDSNTSTLFHSSSGHNTGYIIWAGTEQFVLASIQFTAQSGFASRLPRLIEFFGSNDSGATWTSIKGIDTNNGQDEIAILDSQEGNVSYTWFKIQINSCNDSYVTFAELMLKGWPVE